MENNGVKNIWADAMVGGAVIGIIVTAFLFITFGLAGGEAGFLIPAVEFFAVAYCACYYSRQRGKTYGDDGYTFGQSLGFIVLMMLFAGFIYGIGYFFLVNYVAADYFAELMDRTIGRMKSILGGMVTDEVVDGVLRLMRNPFYWVFVGVATMVVYGMIPGIIVSLFVKRPRGQIENHNRNEYES